MMRIFCNPLSPPHEMGYRKPLDAWVLPSHQEEEEDELLTAFPFSLKNREMVCFMG